MARLLLFKINFKTFDLCHLPTMHTLYMCIFSSPEHKVLMVSYCDRALSVVRRCPSCVVRKLFYLNIFSSETTHWILTKLHRNDPWAVPYQSCSNGSDWLHKSRGQKIGFQNAIFKNLLVRNYKAQSFHIWYLASSKGPLPKLFKLCPWGQN